ncbi:jg5026 [Pararge aegeria aegeria]|uniref:Jg5026 protein n=1 Tax=Pararge aegeria aegeria TaxID=348720 RepID=A0A8S4RDU1_9NEOP|nr:jg5026 [Pararge aegeria aegeria]
MTINAEKEKVYSDLAYEIDAMWNVESTVIVPIVVSVNGLLAKSFDQHLKKLSLGCWIKGQIQKAVVLDTARIAWAFKCPANRGCGTKLQSEFVDSSYSEYGPRYHRYSTLKKRIRNS